MAKQLNVFIENKPGRIRAVTKLLGENRINIRALTIQDRLDFGMIKLLVDKPEAAEILLKDNNFACALKDLLPILIDDAPGSLDRLMGVLEEKNINLKDAYGFLVESCEQAVICIEVKDPVNTRAAVTAAGYQILEKEDLYGL